MPRPEEIEPSGAELERAQFCCAGTRVLELGVKKVLDGAVGATFCSVAPETGAGLGRDRKNGENGDREKPRKIRVFRSQASSTPIGCTHDGLALNRLFTSELIGFMCNLCAMGFLDWVGWAALTCVS